MPDATVPQVSFWIANAYWLIPLGVSIVGGIITFLATDAVQKEKIKNLEKAMEEVKKGLQEARDKAIKCEAIIDKQGPLTQTKSPVSLTDRGQRFLEESGGKKLVDDNFSSLRADVETHSPKTAYDVQEFARTSVKILESKDLTGVKDFLFKEGAKLEEFFTVVAIYLRDRILKEKNMDVADVDKQTV